ncbi:MAG: DUF927 domain-containing protein [Betaproteobacteria bacterium]|nr:DUF927 domain-containing protein [Betaproteobacteria bacterium]
MDTNNTPEHIVPPDYVVDANGVWRDLGEKRPPLRLTTSAAFVTALLRDVNATDWSVEIEFTNPDGEACTLLVPYAQILGRRDLSQMCTAVGLFVLPRGESEFAEYLAQCAGSAELPRHRLTTKLGLNLLPDAACADRLSFVMPTGTLLPSAETVPATGERLVFRPPFANPAFSAYASAGTFEESRELLERVRDDKVAIFVLCASISAPFLEAAGVDSIIVHLHGRSSTGKTTRLQLVAMLWGKPLDPQTAGNDVTLIERWHGTANSMENLATTHNGMVLCMDELGGNTDQAFSVYNQTSGRGKNRMTRDGGMQAQRKWSLLSVSTGEVSLSDRLEAASGKPAKTGEVIRGLSIPMDDLPAYEGMSTEEASQHVQALKTRLLQTYGTIGPAFAQYVLDSFGTASKLREELHAAIDVRHAELVETVRAAGHELEPPHVRALRRFALMRVIGEWAADDVLPFSELDIQSAIEAVTLAWLNALPPLNDEDQIVGQVRDWIIRHMGQMIRYVDETGHEDEPYIPSVTKGIRHRRWILLTETDFAEACDGTSTMVAGKLLKRLGILDGEGGKHKKRHQLAGLGLPETFFYSIVTAKLLPATEQADAQAAGPLQTTGLKPGWRRPAPRQDDHDELGPVPRL